MLLHIVFNFDVVGPWSIHSESDSKQFWNMLLIAQIDRFHKVTFPPRGTLANMISFLHSWTETQVNIVLKKWEFIFFFCKVTDKILFQIYWLSRILIKYRIEDPKQCINLKKLINQVFILWNYIHVSAIRRYHPVNIYSVTSVMKYVSACD